MARALHTEAIRSALTRQMKSFAGLIRLYACLAVAMVLFGVIFFFVLLHFIPEASGDLFKEVAKLPALLVTFGATGYFLTRALALWESRRKGMNWLAFYEHVCGPPPQELAATVEEKILKWLES